MPNGEDYWVFSWTKGTLYVNDRNMPYEIIDGKLYIGVVDYKTNSIDNYVVYEKVDSKEYTKDEISIKDDTNIPYVKDKEVVGFWEAVDYVRNFDDFKVGQKFWSCGLLLKEYIFKPDGTLIVSYNLEDNNSSFINWSKGVVVNKNRSTVSKYTIKEINGEKFMFVEWKSGDYTFGGEVCGYYVFKKLN